MELTPDERMRVAETWNFRYTAELMASERFKRLAVDLRDTGAAREVIRLAENAVEDEKRHAILCREIAEEYGFPFDDGPIEVEAVPLAPANLGKKDALLFEVVAFCCITETVNTAMLVDTLSFATEERIRGAVRTILRDEVNHSKLGWAHLTHETALGHGTFFPSVLIPMFSQLGIDEILVRDGARDSPQLAKHGELNDSRRIELFSSVLAEVVLPGLEAAGIRTIELRKWLGEQGVKLECDGTHAP